MPTALLLPSLPSRVRLFLSLHSLPSLGRCCSSLWHLLRPTILLDRGRLVAAASAVAVSLPSWPCCHSGSGFGSSRALLGSHLGDPSRGRPPALCSGTCVCGSVERGRGFRASPLPLRRSHHACGQHHQCFSSLCPSGSFSFAVGPSDRGFSSARGLSRCRSRGRGGTSSYLLP